MLRIQDGLTWSWPEPAIYILGLQVWSLKWNPTWACPDLELSLLTSQPWKLQRRPLVQTPSELYLVMMSSTILFSYWSMSCHWSQPIRGRVVIHHFIYGLKVSCTDIYLRSFNRDEIHAHAPTDISGVQPANLKISERTFTLIIEMREPERSHLQCSVVGFAWVEVIVPSPLVHVVLGPVLASLQGGSGHQATRGPQIIVIIIVII